MLEKILETRTCSQCSSKFDITDIDVDFLTRLAPMIGGQRFDLPFPRECPKCRKMRRYAWRNEKNLYKRKCDATEKTLISLFSPDAPCPVYASNYWYSDKWDAHQYGRDFDFTRSFFEQWGELKNLVPMPGKIISPIMENSDYSDNCGNLKDCYLCFNSANCENCYYCNDFYSSLSCVDSFGFMDSTECYELINASNCYNTHFSYDVKDSKFSKFLYSCDGCEYCYGCASLKNQKYMIYHEQHTESSYFERLKEIESESIEVQKQKVKVFLESIGYTFTLPENRGSEGIYESGEIKNSKNVWKSRTIRNSEDIRYCRGVYDTRLAMDVEIWGDRLDKTYECMVVGEGATNIYFCPDVWGNVSDVYYSLFCVNNVHNCFGCVGLRNAEYCILNKQYTKEEYEILVTKIIEHMQKTGEWGEFFPAKYSHFGYNQTMNMIKYPLSKEEAQKQGYYWSDYEAPFPKVEKTLPGSRLPDNIDEIPDDILSWAIECEVTKKPFRIVKPELDFYRKHHLPIPRKHPDERYKDRTKIYFNY